MKKIFIISAILLVIILLFLGIYNFAFKKDEPVVSKSAQTPTPVSATGARVAPQGAKKITPVSDSSVLSPADNKKEESIMFFKANDGSLWKMDMEGKTAQQVSGVKTVGLIGGAWSPDRTKVLINANNGGKNTFTEYDSRTQKSILLKDGLDTAVWDNLGTKIFYKFYDGKNRTLNVANPDGTGWQKLVDLNFRSVQIAPIPLTSLLSFWNTANANEETQLQTVGIAGGEPQTILKGRFGADYLWAPDGSKALVSSLASKDTKKITLGLVNQQGSYNELNIPTLVSKCVWSQDSKTIYYALPGGIPDGSLMPNDYQANKFFTDDTFWKLDVATGKQERIIEASAIDGKYDSSNLFLSPTEDALFWVNKRDQKLYKLAL